MGLHGTRIESAQIIAGAKALAVVAISTSAAAMLQYGLLLPAVGASAPKLILVMAIFASAAYGGLWPGLLATALCVIIAADTSAVDGASAFFEFSSLESTAPPILLAIVGVVASALAEELHRAQRRAERRQLALQKEIADRRRGEQKIASSEARFRELAESLPDIMFATDSHGVNVYTNQRWSDYTGYARTHEDDTQQRLGKLTIHPDDFSRVRDTWQSALARGTPYESRHRLRGADGSYRWFIVRASPVKRAGDVAPRWFGVATDIDGQMRAEASLRDRDEQLRLALESTGLGVFEIELTTRRMIWSDRCRSIFGYSLSCRAAVSQSPASDTSRRPTSRTQRHQPCSGSYGTGRVRVRDADQSRPRR